MSVQHETTIEAVPNTQNVMIRRIVNAPRDRVYQAHVDADLFQQWIGPRGLTMTLDEFNVVQGGAYRYSHTDQEGNTYRFHGVFHDAQPNERIVQTFEFEGAPGHVCLETLTLSDADGGTLLTVESVYQSVEDRDAAMQSGMEVGIVEGYQRLEELLAGK